MDDRDHIYRKIISGDIVNSNVNLRILGTVNGAFFPDSELVGVDDAQELYNKIITDDTNVIAAQYLHSPGGLVNVSTTNPTAGHALVAVSGTEATWQNISNIGFIDMQAGGLKSGGKITATVGLNIGIDAGSGYVFDVSEDAITWPTQVILLPDNTYNYVYVNDVGTIAVSSVNPDITEVVFLGTVYTSGGVIQVIDQVPIDDSHLSQRVEEVFIETIGAIVINGMQASTVGLTVNVTAGSYGVGKYVYNPSIVNTAAFRAFWLSSSTIWTGTLTSTIDTTQYNNTGTFTLTPITVGKYVKHEFLTIGEGADQQYILIYGQGEYNTLLDAAASVNSLPPFCTRGVPRLACFVFQSGAGSVTVIDARPLFPPVGGSGSSTVTPHAATHLPSGTDPLTTSTAVGLNVASTNAEGSANAFARSDHTHAIDISGFNLNSLTGTLGIAKGGTNLTAVTDNFFVSGAAGTYVFAKAVPGGTVVGTTDTQSMTNKTFLDTVIITQTTNQLRLGTGTTVTVTAPTPAASAVYTIPDVGTVSSFVMTTGTQTIGGAKTFSGTISIATLNITTAAIIPAVSLTNTTNQLVLGTGTTITLTAPTPASAAVYTIPDVGTTSSFVMTAGAQTISGNKVFSNTTSMNILNGTSVNATNLAALGGSIVFGTVTTTTITAAAPVTSAVYTVPDVGTTASFVMTAGAQTITGTKTFTTIAATTLNATTLNVTNLSTAAVSATNTTNQLILGTGTTITITAPTPIASGIYTIPDVGTTSSFVMSAGAQTVGGTKTFSSSIVITPTTNQIVLGTGTTTTINAAAPAASAVYTVPDVGTTSSFVMTTGTQTISGAKTFSSTLNGTSAVFSGAVTMSALTAVNTTNQITLGTGTTIIITAPSPLASGIYTIPDVGTTSSFVMTTGAQTIGGAKTLTSALSGTTASFSGSITGSAIIAVNTTNQIVLGTGTTTTINAAAPAASAVYTIPDVGTTSSFVMTTGTQTVGGAKTFSSAIIITPTTNQIVLGTGTTTTISAAAPAASAVYTVPDVGTTSSFVMTTGAQTIGGVKTFSARPVMSSGATLTDISITNTSDQIVFGTGTLTTITVPTATSARKYTVTDVGADANFVMTAGAQTIGGAKTFSATMTAAAINAAAISGTTGTFSSTISGTTLTVSANANQFVLRTGNTLTISAPTMGASLVYTLPDLNVNADFVMSAGAQTIGGAKTFSSAIIITPTTNQIVLGTGTTTTISAAAPAASAVYTVPDVGTTSSFVMTTGTQTITGTKTFSTVNITSLNTTTITLSATSNQMVLGTGTTVTITAPTPAASAVYTVPDVGTTSSFVMTTGTQTIGGAKTFSSTLNGTSAVFSSTVTGTVLQTTSSQVAFVGTNTVTVVAAASAATRIYTIPDVSVDADFVMAAGPQTIGGAKTFTTSISTNGLTGTTGTFSSTISALSLQINAGTNQITLGTGNNITLTTATVAAPRTYTIPEVLTSADFVMTAGNQTIGGGKTFSGSVSIASLILSTITASATSNQLVLGTTNTVTITAPTPAASSIYTIPDVGTTSSFVMTTGTQTIGGAKTFTSQIVTVKVTATNTSNQIILGGATNTTINAVVPAASSVYNIPDVGTAADFVMTAGAQTIGGGKTFSSALTAASISTTTLTATNTTNQLFLGTGNTVTITAPSPAASSVYTVPDVGTVASFVMTAGAQTIAGNKTFTGTLTIAVFSAATLTATNTTNQITLGAGNTVTINAPTPASSSTYTVPDVGASANFVMTAGTQTIGGSKTFSSAVNVSLTSNQIVLGTGTTITITAPTPTASGIYTIPDVGTTSSFVMTTGAQTIGGAKTFSGAIAVTPTTNQIVLGTGTTTTISAAAPAASAVYTVPDVGTASSFVMTAGAQTISGAKTFSSAVVITTTSNQLILGNINTATVSADTRAASSVYTIPDVGTSAAFILSAGSQTITGTKTFGTVNVTTANITTAVITTFSTANLTATATSNQLTLGTGNTIVITAPTPAVTVTYTIPDVGTNTSFIMGAGSQTVGGTKTFSSAIAVTPTTNQIVLGTGTTTTINAAAPAASSIYTIPDVGTASSFVMTTGAQTISGAKTFSSAIVITPTTNQIVLGTGTTTTINAAAPAASAVYTVPDVGTTSSFVMTAGTQTITGTKTFGTVNITTAVITSLSSAVLVATATSNQLILGTTNTVTITAPAPAASAVYTIPDVGTASSFVMTSGAQTIGGAKTFSSAIAVTPTTNQIVLGTGTTTTISAAAPAASAVYTIPDVGTTSDFVMTAGAQTITGVKTFGTINATELDTVTVLTANIDITDTSNQISMGTGTTIILSAPSPVANRVYTIPDALTNASFVMTAGNQTISDIKTFNSIVVTSATITSANIVSISLIVLTVTSTANQIVLGSGATTTISAPAPAVSRTVTIPTGGAASFIMTSTDAGTQTITDTIQSGNFDATFGDGSDGNVVINGTTTNLASDMYYNNLTITSGGIINTACFRVFVRNTLTLTGTSFIRCNGGNGSGLTGGTSPSTGPMGSGSAGGAGRNTAGVGTASTARNPGIGGPGGTGGTATVNNGGAGGAITSPAANVGGAKVLRNIVNATLGRTVANVQVLAGSGGGGGGATIVAGTAISGGGGGAGSILFVAARRTIIDGTSFLQANGGNGAAGAVTATSVAGGGGGGGGGFTIFVSNDNYTANLQANGGSGGAGAGGGSAGANGSAGGVCMLINQV